MLPACSAVSLYPERQVYQAYACTVTFCAKEEERVLAAEALEASSTSAAVHMHAQGDADISSPSANLQKVAQRAT